MKPTRFQHLKILGLYVAGFLISAESSPPASAPTQIIRKYENCINMGDGPGRQ